MKVMGKFVKFYVGSVLGIAAMSCDYQDQPEPPNGIIKEIMTVEYDFILGFDAGSDNRAFPEIRDNVKQAYMQTGTTFLPYRDDAHTLPYYQGNSNARFPDNDGNALKQYAKDNRHTINGAYMNYHYLSVNYAISNLGALLQVPGASVLLTGYNQSQTPVNERCTFLFWGDIVAKTPLAIDIRRTAVASSVHELGHQRMGLTHLEDFPQYHNSSQQYYICVMRANLSGINTTPTDYQLIPVFCSDGDANNTNSCRDWLKQANP